MRKLIAPPRLIVALCILLFGPFTLRAQTPNNGTFTGCGSDAALNRDSLALRQQNTLDSLASVWFSHPSHAHNSISAVAYIPVVVHIVHNNGPENISDAQVQTAISNINAKYAASNGNHIQFCLAQRDPLGNATTGITRTVSPLTTADMDFDNAALKAIDFWPSTCYLNIWVIRDINSVYIGNAVIGYATFPSSAGTAVDGVVIEAGFFGVDPASDAVGAHEIGHYLGLYHTFQNGCTNNNCLTDGDMVCDTPPDQSTFASCIPPSNSCSTDTDDPSSNNPFTSDVPDLSEDYMDYSNFTCYNQFTAGQYTRMMYFINNTRSSLLHCLSCTTPCPNPVTATITMPATAYYASVGNTVNFTGTGSNPGLQWYINPGSIISTTSSASYTFNTAGIFWVKFVSISTDPTMCTNGIDSVKIIVTEPVVTSCGGSLHFDDTSPAVALPLTNQYYTGLNGGYTWECWFKLDQLPTGTLARPLISSIDGVIFEDMFLGFGWDGGWFDEPVSKLVWKVDGPNSAAPNGPNCAYTPPGGFITGTWYHAAGVANYTTQVKKLFLNGVLVDTKPLTYAPNTRAIESELSFAYASAWSTGPRPLYGNEDEVRIWSVAKSDAEILANYNTCMSGTEPNLFLYYRCNQSAGTSVLDASPNGTTGTWMQASGWSTENAPISGSACVAACIEICGNGIDDNGNGQIDEGCVCPTISVGADTIICTGGNVTLLADTTFTTYSWTPAASLDNPSIAHPVASPTTTTDYTLTATVPGPNFIVNPDFSAGNVGFTSGQTYSTTYTPCNYYVGPLFFINNYNMDDHTPSSDNMYMSIDGCVNGPTMIWEETITVLSAGTNYTFSFWATRADVAQPTFEIHFIGNITGDVVMATVPGIPYTGGAPAVWDQYGIASWNSGANTSVTIRIINLATAGAGVDFGVDDFLFGKLCTATDTVRVTVVTNPAAPLNIGPDISLCASATHTFDAGAGHMNYHWSDGSDLQHFTAHEPGTYWVTVTDSCGGVQTDSVHITQTPAPVITASNDTAICIGNSVQLSFLSGSNTFPNLLWSPAAGLSCTSCPLPVATPSVTTKYYIVASTSDGCTAVDSIEVTVGTSDPHLHSLSQACDSSGTVTLIGSGGIAPYLFNFNNLGYSPDSVYTVTSTNTYPLSIKDSSGCVLDTMIRVLGNVTPPTAVSYTTQNVQCLPNGALIIHGVNGGTPPYTYNFNNLGFSSDSAYNGLNAGTYTLTVQDSMHCQLDVPVTINVDYLSPTSAVIFTAPYTCDSGGVVFVASVVGGTAPYLYAISPGAYSSSNYFNDLQSGLYALGVKDSNGCKLDTTFTISVLLEDEVVYIPNCFTPNSDIYNATWFIKGSCIESINCHIYNRWGEEIAKLQSLEDFWDGTYKGQMVPEGVYFYIVDIDYHSQNTERKSGSISVFR